MSVAAGICLALGLACADADTPPRDASLPSAGLPAASLQAADLETPDLDAAVPLVWPDCEVNPPHDLKRIFVSAAQDHPGVTSCYLAKQAWCESNWRPRAVSPAGAIGISQFLPGTAADLGIDPWNPRESIRGQARYVLWQRGQWTPPAFGGRASSDIVKLGGAGYNWGLGNVLRSQSKHGWVRAADGLPTFPRETRDYIQCIDRGMR